MPTGKVLKANPAQSFSFKIDPETKLALEKLAKASERTLAGEIRHAIRQHIERNGTP